MWLQQLLDALVVQIAVSHDDLLEAEQSAPHRLVPLTHLRAIADLERVQVGHEYKRRIADTGAFHHVEVLEAGQLGEMCVRDLLAKVDVKGGQVGQILEDRPVDMPAPRHDEFAEVGQVRKHCVADTGASTHVEVLEAGQIGQMRVHDLIASGDIEAG